MTGTLLREKEGQEKVLGNNNYFFLLLKLSLDD